MTSCTTRRLGLGPLSEVWSTASVSFGPPAPWAGNAQGFASVG
jgi:hypothetical protein